MSTEIKFENKGRSALRTPLLQAASWLSQSTIVKKRATTELVTALLTHGARAWRMSQPRTHMRIKIQSPYGYRAVRIKNK